jgi:hypothetical protein
VTGVLYILAGGIVGALVAVTTFASLAYVSKRDAGKQDARCVELSVRLELAQANVLKQTKRADSEKKRGDRLDAAIAKMAAKALGPVHGSAAELLQEVSRIRSTAPDGGDTSGVRDDRADGATPEPIDPASDSDLLRPGE